MPHAIGITNGVRESCLRVFVVLDLVSRYARAETARSGAGRSGRHRRSRQPVQRATSSTRGSRRSGVSASIRSTTTRSSRGNDISPVRRSCGRRRFVGAWRDPGISGLIGARGGYGSAQLLPLLDRDEARAARKPFIGYSDLTSILTFLTIGCGVIAFHGPTLDGRLGRGRGGYDRASLMAAIAGREPMGELAPEGLETVRRGEAAGPLLGGTVTQLLASLGTPFAFAPPQGFVLFFDEVGERPYRLDRMMTQLRQTGLLARAAAVVVGELRTVTSPAAIRRRGRSSRTCSRDFPGPVVFGFPSGHTSGPAMTLPFGVACRVVADSRPRLVIEEAAVE